jgi:hypothetical protein
VLALWLCVVRPQFEGNLMAMRYTKGPDYYVNFVSWGLGLKSDAAYNDYFDRRVNLTQRLASELGDLGSESERLYIWGEYPWVYALAESTPADRYMTSFYTLLIPYLDWKLRPSLDASDPRFIVVMSDAWPRHRDDTGVLQSRYARATRSLNALLAERYELALAVGRARVFRRTVERAFVEPNVDRELQTESDTSDSEDVETMELGRR